MLAYFIPKISSLILIPLVVKHHPPSTVHYLLPPGTKFTSMSHQIY